MLLKKIEKVILPICRELTDPKDDLLYTERFFAGLNARYDDDTVAFVFKEDRRKVVHFTEHFSIRNWMSTPPFCHPGSMLIPMLARSRCCTNCRT